MTKILQIQYSGLGGTGSVFFSLVEASLQQKKHQYQHHAIFYGIEPLVQSYAEKCEALNVNFEYFKKEKGVDFANQKAIRKAIKTIQPDVIILHSSQTIFACKWHCFFNSNCQLIVVEHQANHLKTQKQWFLSKLALKWANSVVYLTQNYRAEVEKKFPNLFHKSNSKVIPNGIDLSVFYPPEKRNDAHCLTKPIILGMASRITPNKDHETLIEAIDLLRNKPYFNFLKLQIAGDGTTLEKLQKKVSSLKLEKAVFFTGMLSEKELAKFLRSLDIYVHASYGETMSTAIMQAQATALPIIGSNVKGINNVIENEENGFLYELENAQSLADKIDELMMNPEKQTRFSEASLTFATNNLSFQKMWASYEALFVKNSN